MFYRFFVGRSASTSCRIPSYGFPPENKTPQRLYRTECVCSFPGPPSSCRAQKSTAFTLSIDFLPLTLPTNATIIPHGVNLVWHSTEFWSTAIWPPAPWKKRGLTSWPLHNWRVLVPTRSKMTSTLNHPHAYWRLRADGKTPWIHIPLATNELLPQKIIANSGSAAFQICIPATKKQIGCTSLQVGLYHWVWVSLGYPKNRWLRPNWTKISPESSSSIFGYSPINGWFSYQKSTKWMDSLEFGPIPKSFSTSQAAPHPPEPSHCIQRPTVFSKPPPK